MEDPAHQLQDGGALFNGKGFAHGLAADGQAGNQGRDGQGDHHGAEGKRLLEPGDDDGGGGAGDDAADVAHHVVAEAGNLAGLPDEAQGLPGAGVLWAAMEWKGRSSAAVTDTPMISNRMPRPMKQASTAKARGMPAPLSA